MTKRIHHFPTDGLTISQGRGKTSVFNCSRCLAVRVEIQNIGRRPKIVIVEDVESPCPKCTKVKP